MACCHADFAALEGSDRGFTIGMPTFTFGAGVLAEAGDNAAELGLAPRRALHRSQPRRRRARREGRARRSKPPASIASSTTKSSIEPTDRSFQDAARFAREANVDGYVSVGGGSVIDTCKAANLYATQPAEFMTYVNAPIGAGQRVPGPGEAAHRVSDDVGHGLGDDRHLDLHADVAQREDRHHFAPPDPDGRARRSRRDAHAAGERRRRDRFRLHEPCARIDHRAALSAAAQSCAGHAASGVAGRKPVLRCARRRRRCRASASTWCAPSTTRPTPKRAPR